MSAHSQPSDSFLCLLVVIVSLQHFSVAAQKKTESPRKKNLPQVASHSDGVNIVIVDNDMQGENGERKAYN